MYALRCVHMPRAFLFAILVVTIPEECVYSNLIIELSNANSSVLTIMVIILVFF